MMMMMVMMMMMMMIMMTMMMMMMMITVKKFLNYISINDSVSSTSTIRGNIKRYTSSTHGSVVVGGG